MKINIRTLTGQTYAVNVNATNTVRELKSIIQQKYGIPMEKFSLTISGKHLMNDELLSVYNLSENSILHLVYKTYGG